MPFFIRKNGKKLKTTADGESCSFIGDGDGRNIESAATSATANASENVVLSAETTAAADGRAENSAVKRSESFATNLAEHVADSSDKGTIAENSQAKFSRVKGSSEKAAASSERRRIFSGAAILGAGTFLAKLLGALYRIPLTALLGGAGICLLYTSPSPRD